MKQMLFLLAFALVAGRGFSQNLPVPISSGDSLAAIRQVDSLIQVSRTLTGKNDFDQALEVVAAAEKIALEKLGRESAGYGSCCFIHGVIVYSKENYPEAKKWYLEAIAIQEKTLGKENTDYVSTLSNLGIVYHLLGQYKSAESMYLECIAIREKVSGKTNPLYAGSLNNLANLYVDMGQISKAELYLLEAKEILEVGFREHPFYPNTLGNLARLYFFSENYEKAEPLLLETIAIREKTQGKEYVGYEKELGMMGSLYMSMGNYKKAELLLLEVKAIQEKTKGTENSDYATALNQLAILYKNMGNFEKAEPLYHEAIAIREKTLGKEHPDYAQSLNNLGILYMETGNYEKAEPLYLESKTIRGNAEGMESPNYAASLNNLANLYTAMGHYEKAERLHLEAKAIREKTQGKEHSDYRGSLINLAVLYEDQKRYSESEALQVELAELNQSHLAQSATYLSERELSAYTAIFQSDVNDLLSVSFARPAAEIGKMPALLYAHSLLIKGFLFHAAVLLNTLASSNPNTAELNIQLQGCRRRLATQYALPIAERNGVEELEETANALEKDLARSVAGYSEAMRQVKWQEVQEKLKPGEAAIEFVNYRFLEIKQPAREMYAALVLLPGNDLPKFVPLFEEKQIDSLLQRNGERNELYVKQLYSLADRGVIAVGKPQKTLYQILWQPLEAVLAPLSGGVGGGVKTVYFSPSGLLHRINLGATPITDEETLSDRFQLVELGSTRQLVVPQQVVVQNQNALLFGGIQYDMDSTAIAAVNLKLDSTAIASRGGLSFAQTDSTLRSGSWNYLPGTEKEVVALEKIMQTNGLTTESRRGYAATEEAFKAIGNSHGVTQSHPVTGSPRILHLATHGFFFPDPKEALNRQPFAADRDPIFRTSDNPLIRSGLIMAGGNFAWQTGKPLKPGMEDGILTAYEISQMDLSNTELVVLSACETGLGDIEGNEGVYGLQRAFKIAGAKYLIMSLWQVPDKQTARLMTIFYQKWLTEKMPIPEAFRAAQKELRERGFDPFYWAGFVLVE